MQGGGGGGGEYVCACYNVQALWLGRGELTGLVAKPVILSSDQSNTTAFKLFNG